MRQSRRSTPLGLEVDPIKRDALELADEEGNAFMSLFTTFGSFSIFAGVLLIFLIFVMLAAERRGRARASPARSARAAATWSRCTSSRGSPTTSSPPRSARCSASPSRSGWCSCLASALDFTGVGDRARRPAWRASSSAYGVGVLLTFVVVRCPPWRVSRLNIVAAIRNTARAGRAHARGSGAGSPGRSRSWLGIAPGARAASRQPTPLSLHARRLARRDRGSSRWRGSSGSPSGSSYTAPGS